MEYCVYYRDLNDTRINICTCKKEEWADIIAKKLSSISKERYPVGYTYAPKPGQVVRNDVCIEYRRNYKGVVEKL